MVIGGQEVISNSSESSIPEEFLCAINGHIMKDPVRASRSGLVFEKATIQIWLQTRGQVCPITHEVFMLLMTSCSHRYCSPLLLMTLFRIMN